MSTNIVTAVFADSSSYCRASGTWQYDYGQILRIQGLNLPKAVEIQFSLDESSGTTVSRIATTKDGVTDVLIPDSMLENGNTAQNYNVCAFVFLSDESSGNTEYRIKIPVKARPKPEIPGTPEEPELFRKAVEMVQQDADRAEEKAAEAESWAHGHEQYPDRSTDNARYYADQAHKEAVSIPGRVEEGKKNIDSYITEKKAELKGNTGNVFFAAFRVSAGRLKMYSDPSADKVCFKRSGSRLKYSLKI